MAIPNKTVLELFNEGIDTVDDISEFYKEATDQIVYNLHLPPSSDPFISSAKSQKRIIVAWYPVRYYKTIGRAIADANIQWTTVMKNFKIQWKSLIEKKRKYDPETPKISKSLNIMKWGKAFRDVLRLQRTNCLCNQRICGRAR